MSLYVYACMYCKLASFCFMLKNICAECILLIIIKCCIIYSIKETSVGFMFVVLAICKLFNSELLSI